MTCAYEVMGRYAGREILEVTYQGPKEGFVNPHAPFHTKVFAFREEPGVRAALRPFFIVSGSEVRWFDRAFVAEKGVPFGLEIAVTTPGNSVATSIWTFGFSEAGAKLESLKETARTVPEREIIYGPAGKVEKTSASEGN